MRFFRIFLFVFSFLLCGEIFAQSDDDYTVEMLINDVNTRKLDRAIPFMERMMLDYETENKNKISDALYSGLATLLASAYVYDNRINRSDSLVTHAISVLKEKHCPFENSYGLYFAVGALQCNLGNYEKASKYLIETSNWLRGKLNLLDDFITIHITLAFCHSKLEKKDMSVSEMRECHHLAEQYPDSIKREATLIQLYDKSAVICNELDLPEEALRYSEKAYTLSKDNEAFTVEHILATQNIATGYADKGEYVKALKYYNEIENYPLSFEEQALIYSNIYTCQYFCGNVEECVKYVKKCNDAIKKRIMDVYSSFPSIVAENLYHKYLIQLSVNDGILRRFPNEDEAIRQAYDNRLFVKTLLYNQKRRIDCLVNTDSTASRVYQKYKQLRSRVYLQDQCEEDDRLSYRDLCLNAERDFQNLYHLHNGNQIYSDHKTYDDIRRLLRPGEAAIEILSFAGFEPQDTVLSIGAIVLNGNDGKMDYVELCFQNEIHELSVNAIVDRLSGRDINSLFAQGDLRLYNLIWRKLDDKLKGIDKVYISPDLELNDVNFPNIPCPDGSRLYDHYDINVVTSTANIGQLDDKAHWNDALIYGGIYYNSKLTEGRSMYRDAVADMMNDSTRSSFSYLPGSAEEVDKIGEILKGNGCKIKVQTGVDASENSFREIDRRSPELIHLSTHAFYLVGFKFDDSYFDNFSMYSEKDESMLMSGVLFSNANNSFHDSRNNKSLDDGIMTSEEISLLDLSNTKLLVLSACNTAMGVTREGYGGLVKAFKLAGVKRMVVTTWAVPDQSTSLLMSHFYRFLSGGNEIHKALIMAQKETAKTYPDPYYWAGFMVLD